jgi:hypothetical protein
MMHHPDTHQWSLHSHRIRDVESPSDQGDDLAGTTHARSFRGLDSPAKPKQRMRPADVADLLGNCWQKFVGECLGRVARCGV